MGYYRGHTRLTQLQQVDTGEKDRYGNPIYTSMQAPVWGDLVPLASEEYTDAQQTVITRFRVMLPASFDPVPTTNITDPNGLVYAVKGGYETHRIRGQVHHHEAIVERVTG